MAQNKTIPLNEPDYNKPKLFQDLPDRIDITPENLQYLFQLTVGQSVSIPFAANFNFTGQVVSTSDAGKQNAKTVVIKSTNRIGASLTFTKVFITDGSVKYIGRIISLQNIDTYEIVFDNNQYYFKKKGLYDMVNE
jgi:hypothetical protein